MGCIIKGASEDYYLPDISECDTTADIYRERVMASIRAVPLFSQSSESEIKILFNCFNYINKLTILYTDLNKCITFCATKYGVAIKNLKILMTELDIQQIL